MLRRMASAYHFPNRLMTTLVREALVKLGVPLVGEYVDLAGPGPVLLVRLIRDPTGPHPRAAVFLSVDHDLAQTRSLVVTTYRREGEIDRTVAHNILESSWQDAEPEAVPMAHRTSR